MHTEIEVAVMKWETVTVKQNFSIIIMISEEINK
jgi:hypothetical protein